MRGLGDEVEAGGVDLSHGCVERGSAAVLDRCERSALSTCVGVIVYRFQTIL